MDKHFRVETINRTEDPNRVIYAAMHQDYSEEFVYDELGFPNYQTGIEYRDLEAERKLGDLIVKHLLKGNRGHFGCLEHPQIILNCGWFPHSVMQQARTHRVGISFDCQSFRYTGKRIIDVATVIKESWESDREGCINLVEKIFYIRPIGHYSDRQGKKYDYTEEKRHKDLLWCVNAVSTYRDRINEGYSEEHARGLIPFDVRQHWVMSLNARSLMHFLDLRWKADAQLEITQLCDLIYPHFESWMPEVANWYMENRAKKARLAP